MKRGGYPLLPFRVLYSLPLSTCCFPQQVDLSSRYHLGSLVFWFPHGFADGSHWQGPEGGSRKRSGLCPLHSSLVMLGFGFILPQSGNSYRMDPCHGCTATPASHSHCLPWSLQVQVAHMLHQRTLLPCWLAATAHCPFSKLFLLTSLNLPAFYFTDSD